MVNTRKKHPIEFKLKVDSEACTRKITLAEMASKFGINTDDKSR
jgi:transposase-like protein